MVKVIGGVGVCVACVLAVESAMAVIVPGYTIRDLVQKSDVVAIGTLVGVTRLDDFTISKPDARPINGYRKSGALIIDQVLKGVILDLGSVSLTFDETDTFIGYPSVPSGLHAIFFLKRAVNHYEFTSPYYPFLRALPGAAATGEGLEGIISATVALLRATDVSAGERSEAIYVLRELRATDAASVAALRTAMTDTNSGIRQSALAALVAIGDADALAVAETALAQPAPDASERLLADLRVALSQELEITPATLTVLIRLSSASDVATRRAVVQGLKRVHSPSTIPLLASALDDSDLEVRHYAVMGLAAANRQPEWSPSRDEFLRNEMRYVGHWREWLKTR